MCVLAAVDKFISISYRAFDLLVDPLHCHLDETKTDFKHPFRNQTIQVRVIG